MEVKKSAGKRNFGAVGQEKEMSSPLSGKEQEKSPLRKRQKVNHEETKQKQLQSKKETETEMKETQQKNKGKNKKEEEESRKRQKMSGEEQKQQKKKKEAEETQGAPPKRTDQEQEEEQQRKKKKKKGKEKETERETTQPRSAPSPSPQPKAPSPGHHDGKKKQQQKQKLKIELNDVEAASAPVLACFPNAPPPPSKLHNEEGGIHFSVWENKGAARTKRMLVGETDKMLYLGEPTRESSKYLVMAVDRTAGKAKLVPVPHFFQMQQQIKGYVPHLANAAEDSKQSSFDQRKALVERFGSKKRQTQSHSRMANSIDENSVSHADEMMSTINDKAAREQETESTTELYPELPPYNLYTDTVSRVYPLSSIIPNDYLDQIDPMPLIKAANDGSNPSEIAAEYGEYIAERVNNLKGLLRREQERQARLMALVGALLKLRAFISTTRKQFFLGEVKNVVGSILSEDILRHFLPLFAEGEQRRYSRSALGMTRITNYILILLLHLSDWRLELAPLATTLKMDGKKCRQVFVSIGCKSVLVKKQNEDPDDGQGTARFYVLRAPLRLPDKVKQLRSKKM